MRESQGQSRRGTPTGERALQGARLPQGKRLRTAPVGVLLPFLSFRSFFRAPYLIVMNPARHSRIDLTKVGIAAKVLALLAS
jgi:hypothetical protein